MSEIGPLRHFAATQQFGRFRSEADIQELRLQPDAEIGQRALVAAAGMAASDAVRRR